MLKLATYHGLFGVISFLCCMIIGIKSHMVHELYDGIQIVDPNDNKEGRIPELDGLLKLYSKSVAMNVHMKEAILQVKSTSQKLVHYDPVLVDYYTEVLELIQKHGVDAITHERERLNGIITSAGSRNDVYGQQEMKEALKKRSIIESFIDAAASYVLHEMEENSRGGKLPKFPKFKRPEL